MTAYIKATGKISINFGYEILTYGSKAYTPGFFVDTLRSQSFSKCQIIDF